MLKIQGGREAEDRGPGLRNSGSQVWICWIAKGWLDRDEAGEMVDAYQGWRIVVDAGVGSGFDSARAWSNGSARMCASACLCLPACLPAWLVACVSTYVHCTCVRACVRACVRTCVKNRLVR